MKNKIAIASAFVAASSLSFAEIALTENLSVEGFVDMSYSHAEDDFDGVKESTNSYTLDQVEITFNMDFDEVSAQIDLEWDEGTDAANVDQGFVTYDRGNGTAITAGRYDSMLGFEAFEPTGLYQYSTAYSSDTELLVDANITYSDLITPGTNEGVKITHENDSSFFGISIQDGGFFGDDRLGGDSDSSVLAELIAQLGGPGAANSSGYAVEAAFATDLGNGLSLFAGALFETAEVDGIDVDSTVFNTYITYETGAWLFAAEYIMTEHDFDNLGELEIDSFLVMANYSYSDQASITGRVSHVDADDFLEATKFTLAHNYAFTDNLLLVTELSTVDYDYADGGSGDTLEAAVELLFTF
jgi:hypothetical protein